MKKVVLGFVLAAALFGALSYHVILASGRWIVERKSQMGFTDTFVDARDWTLGDYLANPGITAILAEHGVKRLVGAEKGVVEEGKEALGEAAEKIGGRK